MDARKNKFKRTTTPSPKQMSNNLKLSNTSTSLPSTEEGEEIESESCLPNKVSFGESEASTTSENSIEINSSTSDCENSETEQQQQVEQSETTTEEETEIIEQEIEVEMIQLSKYNELLEKYQEITKQLSQRNAYISALEAAFDAEKAKVKQLTQQQQHRRRSSKNINSIFTFKEKVEEEDPILKEKENHKKFLEKKEIMRKQELDARRNHLEDKKKIHRVNILQEILNTERDYVETLSTLVHVQTMLLKHNVVSEEENEYLFANITEILTIHRNNSNDLNSRLLSFGDEECWNASVGDIFLKLADSLSIYIEYINNENVQATTAESCAHKKLFINTLYREIPEIEDKTLGLNRLRSLLITPMQRLCKYPLLLRELIHATENSHSDSSNLLFALEKLQEAAMAVNEEKKVQDQIQKMQSIADSLDNAKGFEINSKNRVFIKEGDLLKISKGKTQERHFYLFNDLIIYGSKSLMKSGKIFMKGKIYLDKLIVNDIEDSDSTKNCFEVVRLDNKKKKYIICSKLSGSKGEEDKKCWMVAIRQQVEAYRRNVEKRSRIVHDNWEPTPRTQEIFKKTLKLTKIVRK